MKNPQDLTVGKFLQQERERKGLSLEAVSNVTRISERNLEAIESDDFAALPAPIFIRSFLKAYASVIGVDGNKAIALYEAQTGVIGVTPQTTVPPAKELSRKILLLIIPILVLLIGGGIYLFSSSSRKAPEPVAPVSPPAVAPETPKSAPAPPETPPGKEIQKQPIQEQPKKKQEGQITPPAKGAPVSPQSPPGKEVQKQPAKEEPKKKQEGQVTPPPAQPTQPLASSIPPTEEKMERRHILRVQAREQTWVRVQADDQPEFEVLLEPQEKAVWTARRQLKIILGNAGGVDMTFDGKRVGPFGETGQVVHLQFPLAEKKSGQ